MIEQQRILATSIPGPRSQELQARKAAAVASGVGTGLPVYVTDGAGGIIRDVDGNQLIDLGSGIAVTTVGNGNQRVVDAVTEQIRRFTHTCFMVTPYEPYLEVCERLNALTPGDHEKRSALFNSGAEAVENAVKIARHATGRQAVVVFEHGYHGRTNLTMGMTAKNMPYKDGFGPFAPEIYRVPMAYPYRWPGGPERCAEEALRTVTDLVHTLVGEQNTAAVVIEPIQGEGGFIVPPEGFLPGLADWCREHGILLVADEVQSGFCRTGDWFACDHEGVVPDLVTTAKGIAGGMPLAAVTGRAELMDSVHGGGLGGTYGGNPVACAAALASITSMEAGRPRGPCAGHRQDPRRPAGVARRAPPRDRGRPGPRRDDGDGAGHRPRHEGTRGGARRRGQRGLPRPRCRHAHLRHVRQRLPVPAAALDRR